MLSSRFQTETSIQIETPIHLNDGRRGRSLSSTLQAPTDENKYCTEPFRIFFIVIYFWPSIQTGLSVFALILSVNFTLKQLFGDTDEVIMAAAQSESLYITKHIHPAMTRIRTWVSAATTQGTNHYTIMATQGY